MHRWNGVIYVKEAINKYGIFFCRRLIMFNKELFDKKMNQEVGIRPTGERVEFSDEEKKENEKRLLKLIEEAKKNQNY